MAHKDLVLVLIVYWRRIIVLCRRLAGIRPDLGISKSRATPSACSPVAQMGIALGSLKQSRLPTMSSFFTGGHLGWLLSFLTDYLHTSTHPREICLFDHLDLRTSLL